MWYVIYCKDRENTLEARLAARPAHLERIGPLVNEGRILLAGPRPAIDSPDPGPAGFEGSLIVEPPDHGQPLRRPVRDLVTDLVAELRPTAAALGTDDQLDDVLQILRWGSGTDRQRRVVERGGTLHDVVRHLIDELASDRMGL